MIDATIVVTFFLSYKVLKKYAVGGIDRPTEKAWSHLQIAIMFGHFAFILGQHFLLSTDASLILSKGTVLVLVLGALLISDLQDVVKSKMPIYLYGAILIEYMLWAALGLIALMSGRFSDGVLFFVACVSRLAEILQQYNDVLERKKN